MPSNVKSKSESSFEPVPTGTHIARCVTVVNLGMQPGGRWDPRSKHYIGFEVPGVRVEWEKDGKKNEGPAIIGNRYTSSLSRKAILRQTLESWRGRAFTEEELDGFDLFKLLDIPCLISVTHSEDGQYANIAAIMGLPKGTVAPDRETPLMKYDPSDPNAAKDLSNLHNWMQETIDKGLVLEAAASHSAPTTGSQPPGDDFDDDIPF